MMRISAGPLQPEFAVAKRHWRSGFTFFEVAIAITILTVAVLAMTATLTRVHSLEGSSREQDIAQRSIDAMLQEVRSLGQEARSADGEWSSFLIDALSPGGSMGDTFETEGLDPIQFGGTVGSIEVITDETLTDADIGFKLGMPRDLDGDGLTTNTDVRGTALVLPILVRSSWSGPYGTAQLSRGIYLMSY